MSTTTKATKASENAKLAAEIQAWLDDPAAPGNIYVDVRRGRRSMNDARRWAREFGVPVVQHGPKLLARRVDAQRGSQEREALMARLSEPGTAGPWDRAGSISYERRLADGRMALRACEAGPAWEWAVAGLATEERHGETRFIEWHHGESGGRDAAMLAADAKARELGWTLVDLAAGEQKGNA